MSAYDLSTLASPEVRHSYGTPREMLAAAVEQLSTAQTYFGLAQSLEAIREAERLIREADLLLARRYRPIEVRRGGSVATGARYG